MDRVRASRQAREMPLAAAISLTALLLAAPGRGSAAPARVDLTLDAQTAPASPWTDPRLLVGGALRGTARAVPDAAAPTPPPDLGHSLAALAASRPPGWEAALSQLADVFDYAPVDLPQQQSDVLRVVAPTRGVQPFAALALDAVPRRTLPRDNGTLGFGGGTLFRLGKTADLGTEVLLFPGPPATDGAGPGTGPADDVRVFTRLQIRF